MKKEIPMAYQSSLADKHCTELPPGTPALEGNEISELIGSVQGWHVDEGQISKSFDFKDYYQTVAFVNMIAFVANRENHHPDLEVGYNKCKVTFSTHSVGGLSENDFICAAKIERLLQI
jgi:4a-hydroxytetrahydrobiopterin dehydratase